MQRIFRDQRSVAHERTVANNEFIDRWTEIYREYAASLQEENAQLQDTYTSGYDLEEVRQIALAMGMVPVEQVPHLQMQVTAPQVTQELSPWESFWTFFLGMFA